MPTTGTIHLPQYINEVVVAYKNPAFIGLELMPPIMRSKKTDSYYVFNKQDRFSIDETYRQHNSEANEVDFGTTTATYDCQDHALRFFFADQDYDNADPPVQEQMNQAEIIADKLLLAQEDRIKDLVFTAGSYPTANKTTLTGTDQWSDYTNSDPFGDIETGRDACVYPPNVAVMGAAVWMKLRHHPDFLERITGGAYAANPGKVTESVAAEIIEVEKILIGRAKYNSTAKKAATYTKLWGKFFALLYVSPRPVSNAVTFGATFQYNPTSGQAGAIQGVNNGWRVRRYRDEARGGGGTFIEVEQYVDEKIVCSDAGYLISTAVA